jgi:hypothetical protein
MSRDNSDGPEKARVGGWVGEAGKSVPRNPANGSSDHGSSDLLSFVENPLPPAFIKHTITVEPSQARPYDETEWLDSLVIVERGEIELECLGNSHPRFQSGAVLCLDGLPIRAIHNPGSEVAVLVAVSRRNP